MGMKRTGLSSVVFAAFACTAAQAVVTSLSELYSLTDAQLTQLFANPVPGLPLIPSLSPLDQWDVCKGATFVNLLTQKSDVTGPSLIPNQDFGNLHLWGASWYGKVFRTSSVSGETYLWNLIGNPELVAITAKTYIIPSGLLNDGIPSIGMNYSLSEIPSTRAFFGEMRYLGNQIYLGKQFIVNPAYTVAHAGSVVDNATPAPFPIFVTYFGLQCGQPVPAAFTQIGISKLSSDVLNHLLGYWPKGYKLPEPVTG